jgi:hypothetical protein
MFIATSRAPDAQTNSGRSGMELAACLQPSTEPVNSDLSRDVKHIRPLRAVRILTSTPGKDLDILRCLSGRSQL